MKMNSETNKGKTCFVYKDNKFREYYRKKNGNVCFRCTVKTCVGYGHATHSFRANINNLLRYLNVRNI